MSENYDRDKRLRERLKLLPIFKRECCKDTNNLVYAVDLNKDMDKCILRCKHCGAVHRRVWVDSGAIGQRGGNL